MPNIERLMQKISRARGVVPLREIEQVLFSYGYLHTDTRGSHFHYRAEKMPKMHFPVHNNKVQAIYAREIVKALNKKK